MLKEVKKFGSKIAIAIAVVFTTVIAVQFGHEWMHFREHTQKVCHHDQNHKAELTHQHHSLEKCLACHFTIDWHGLIPFLPNENFIFVNKIKLFSQLFETNFSFFLSYNPLRGPPTV